MNKELVEFEHSCEVLGSQKRLVTQNLVLNFGVLA